MTQVTNELIYGVLKAIQARQSVGEEHLSEMKVAMHAIRSHHIGQNNRSAAIQIDIAHIDKSLGHLDSRLARIERRLDIIDVPAE